MTSYTVTEYQKVDKPNYIEYLDYFANSKGEKDTSMPGMQIFMNFEEQMAKQQLPQHQYFQLKKQLNKH